jgi:hypothetical protein
MGPEFDIAMANVSSSGQKYKLYFPNYTVQSGRPVPAKKKPQLKDFLFLQRV